MVRKYDFVITSGGIGPTHDGTQTMRVSPNPKIPTETERLLDITYASLAKAFGQPLVHHTETLRRMVELGKHRSWVHTQNEEQKRARERMALFPANAETLFVASDMWVVSSHRLPFPSPSSRIGLLMLSFSLALLPFFCLAGCAAGRETLRFSGHT